MYSHMLVQQQACQLSPHFIPSQNFDVLMSGDRVRIFDGFWVREYDMWEVSEFGSMILSYKTICIIILGKFYNCSGTSCTQFVTVITLHTVNKFGDRLAVKLVHRWSSNTLLLDLHQLKSMALTPYNLFYMLRCCKCKVRNSSDRRMHTDHCGCAKF